MLGYTDRQPLVAAVTTLQGLTVGDKATLPIPMGKWKLEEAFVVYYSAEVGTLSAIEFAYRPAAGTDASRSAACGSAALTLLKPTGAVNGKMLYKRAAADFFVQGGGEVVVSVSVSATASLAFWAGVTLRESPEDPANMTTAAGGGGLVKSA
jgi:hypothetical protein